MAQVVFAPLSCEGLRNNSSHVRSSSCGRGSLSVFTGRGDADLKLITCSFFNFRDIRADCVPCTLGRMVDEEGHLTCLVLAPGALLLCEPFTSACCECLDKLVNVLYVFYLRVPIANELMLFLKAVARGLHTVTRVQCSTGCNHVNFDERG